MTGDIAEVVIEVDGVQVRGAITALERHRVEVEILEPILGVRAVTGNVIYLARSFVNFYEEGVITAQGQERVEGLLRGLFRACREVEHDLPFVVDALRRAKDETVAELKALGALDEESARSERVRLRQQLRHGGLEKRVYDQELAVVRKRVEAGWNRGVAGRLWDALDAHWAGEGDRPDIRDPCPRGVWPFALGARGRVQGGRDGPRRVAAPRGLALTDGLDQPAAFAGVPMPDTPSDPRVRSLLQQLASFSPIDLVDLVDRPGSAGVDELGVAWNDDAGHVLCVVAGTPEVWLRGSEGEQRAVIVVDGGLIRLPLLEAGGLWLATSQGDSPALRLPSRSTPVPAPPPCRGST